MAETRRRADAVRNREAVLEAAEALFARHGPDEVSMGSVAAAAGVGKGTVFRAFTDRGGLLQALAERRTAALREAVSAGPRPLGPGTPPRERVPALLDAVLVDKLENRSLYRALEEAGSASPYRTGTYTWWHTLLRESLAELTGDERAAFLAHALLAAVRADLVVHLVDAEGRPADAVRAQLAAYVRGVLAQQAPDGG